MNDNQAVIYVATTADTKGRELAYVRRLIAETGLPTLTVDLSTQPLASDSYRADISAATVARCHPDGERAVFVAIAAKRLPPWHWPSKNSCCHAAMSLHCSGWAALAALR